MLIDKLLFCLKNLEPGTWNLNLSLRPKAYSLRLKAYS
jgi:hypothetical protein